MRVLLESDHPCRSSSRISQALARYAPAGVELVADEANADLVLLHVGGRFREVVEHVERVLAAGKRFAMLQLVLRACTHPDTADWLPLWRDAVAVWSYYDLADEMRADGVNSEIVNLYRSALGVDPDVFRILPLMSRPAAILAEGDNAERDSLVEIHRGCRKAGARMIHLGPPVLAEHERIQHAQDVDDWALCVLLNGCRFVSGLRTIEGFELVAAEGLHCGARPLLFDRQHHRDWFGGLAEYIPENHAHLANWLQEWFLEGPRPVTGAELAEARDRFAWEPIAAGFWEHVVA